MRPPQHFAAMGSNIVGIASIDGFTVVTGFAHIIIGAVFVYGVFAAVERSVRAAVLFGVGFPVMILTSHTVIGHTLPPVSWIEFKTLVWAAALGTALGGGIVGMFWEPAISPPSYIRTGGED